MEVCLITGLLVATYVLLEATFVDAQETVINVGLTQSKAVVCFVAIWGVYWPGRGQFTLEDLDPTLCTHIIFGYQHLNDTNDKIITSESWTELLGTKPQIRLSKLKARNQNLKVLVCVGGWLDGSIKYSRMAADPKRRGRFVNETVNFIRENGLDGMDLVWQYPGKRGGSTTDKESYLQLLKELRVAFDKYNFTLTACVGSSKDTIDYSYDVPKLSEYLDYMLLYNFDYHGWWSRFTGSNSPLKGADFLNTEYTVNYLLKLGANPKKLILGMPFFARNFILNDTESFDEHTPAFGQKFDGQGFEGPYTEEEGFLGYNEVCLYIKNSTQNWTVYWDKDSYTPMAVHEDKMISFDDDRSVGLKARFAMKNNLGGFFAYAVDYDDFRGDCERKYPLLNTIREELSRYQYEVDNEDNNIVYVETTSGNVRYRLSSIFSALLLIVQLLFLTWYYNSKYDFDGLDLCWLYPSKRDGSPYDRIGFVQLLKEFKRQFQPYSYTLSALLSASYDTIDTGYDVKEISDTVDFMNMNTYDFNGFWSDDIQPNAPLYSNDRWNADYAISYMLKLGADPEKLILGIPLYGRTFIGANTTLLNRSLKLGDPFNSTEEARKTFLGPYTQDVSGVISYGEICLELLNGDKWTRSWDKLTKTPFITHGDKLITYDDRQSIVFKVRYAVDMKLGGVMTSSLDLDDFLGDCRKRPQNVNAFENYLLLRSVGKEIDRYLEKINENSFNVGGINDVFLFNSDLHVLISSFVVLFIFSY